MAAGVKAVGAISRGAARSTAALLGFLYALMVGLSLWQFGPGPMFQNLSLGGWRFWLWQAVLLAFVAICEIGQRRPSRLWKWVPAVGEVVLLTALCFGFMLFASTTDGFRY